MRNKLNIEKVNDVVDNKLRFDYKSSLDNINNVKYLKPVMDFGLKEENVHVKYESVLKWLWNTIDSNIMIKGNI